MAATVLYMPGDKIAVTEFVSLDGVIEGNGMLGDFKHLNWTSEFDSGPEAERFKEDEMTDEFGAAVRSNRKVISPTRRESQP